MFLFRFVLLSVFCCGLSNQVYYGAKLDRVEYPFLAYLKARLIEEDYINHQTLIHKKACGGSIVSLRSILTAAHCIDYGIGEPIVDVYVGAVLMKSFGKIGQHRQMESYTIHPEFLNKNIDMAIIYLGQSLVMVPGKIEIGSFITIKYGDMVTIAGWGYKEFNRKTTTLRKASMRVTHKNCIPHTGVTIDFNCIINPLERSTFCDGDSGGPIIFNKKIAGVISLNAVETVIHNGKEKKICSANIPSLAVDTSRHIQWIYKNR